jgi:hypothetical protein
MIQTPLDNPFVTRAEHQQLKLETEEGFAKLDLKITHLTEAMILGDDKIYIEMGRRFDEMDERFNGRFDEMDRKIGGRFDGVEARLDGLEADVGILKSDVGTLKTDMKLIKDHFGIKG